MSESQFNLVEAVVWSVALLAPLATFLALPKLLPLRRELTWSRIRAQWPLALLAARGKESSGWHERMRAAWLRDVHDEHPEGSARGEVVRDPQLLGRARAVGWVTGGLLLSSTLFAALIVLVSNERYSGRLAFTLALTGLVMAWVGRIAGAGAAMWAQSLALGRGGFGRAMIGFLVGAGYGAIAGFATAFAGILSLVPAMSLLTLDAVSGKETMLAFTLTGVFSAFVGALFGSLLLAPIAVAAKRA